MRGTEPSSVLVLGIGNPDRGDDGAGVWVAERLAERGAPARVCRRDGFTLIESWKGRRRVIVVDATVSGAAPGTISCIDALHKDLPSEAFPVSTHGYGLAEAIAMARTLDRLPAELTVYGIEAASFAVGSPLSLPVQQACAELTERLFRAVGVR